MGNVRKTPLVTGEIYHVFNRGIDKREIFLNDSYYWRAYQTLNFYQYSDKPTRLSYFLRLPNSLKESTNFSSWGDKLVSIFAYCLMPNHYHLLLRQNIDFGISKFIGDFTNSYTKYFNARNNRVGPLLLDDFQNVLVDSEEQFLHTSRYIHLNPYSSSLVDSTKKLLSYEWSSLIEYVKASNQPICDKKMVMNSFGAKDKYKDFIFDRADYQRSLEEFKHQEP